MSTNPDDPELEDKLWAGSPAAVYYELDDGSGRAPGIQVVTDDFAFPTNNCIMASGEREFDGGDTEEPTIVPKTCSDPPSSSKRYFLEIRQADVPVDMVFDVGMKDIRYGGVKDPADDRGEALEAFREEYGIGRIYRAIQKVINNSDERWVGINVEIGHGVGDQFERFNFEEDGVAFELRNLVPREFFEGETGAPDIEVWVPERYATFSPKAFDDGSRERFDPGFFDDAAAGLFPPQDTGGSGDKTPYIFSGDDLREDGAYGAITLNHFSMVDAQAAGSDLTTGVFGYLLSDSLAPYSIALYESGDPSGESDALEAWWDGNNWRYGLAGGEDGTPPFGVVVNDQLQQWAEKLLGLDTDENPENPEDNYRYASILADDLATQNMDVFIYIGDGILNEDGTLKHDNITLRVTGVSSESLGAVTGNATPAWIGEDGENTAPDLSTYMVADGVPVALNDLATMIENDPALNIDVLANDLLDGQRLLDSSATITEITVTPVTGGSAVVVDQGTNAATVDFTPEPNFTGVASFKYTVAIADADEANPDIESNTATVNVRVDERPDPDAPVAANDSAVTFFDTPVTIDVLANDTLPAGTPTIEILDAPPSAQGTAVVEGDAIVFKPDEGYTAFDIPARFIYRVTVDVNGEGKASNAALVTVRIDDTPEIYVPPAEPSSSSGDGTIFGCSYNPRAPFDPTLPLVALAAIAGLVIRNRRKQTLH